MSSYEAKGPVKARVFELTPIKVPERRGSLAKSEFLNDDSKAGADRRVSHESAANDRHIPRNSGSVGHRGSQDDSLIGIRGQALQQKKAKWRNDAFLPRNIEGKQSQEQIYALKNRMKKYDTFAAFVSVTGLVIAFIENEIFYDNGNVSSVSNYVLRGVISGSCVLSVIGLFFYTLVVFLVKHYQFRLNILKSKKIVYETTTLWTSPLLKYFLLEVLISIIHCPPGLDAVIVNYELGITFTISIDAYILFLMFARLYVLFRLFDHYTIWTNPRALRVSKMNGFQADSIFAIKAYLKYRSFWMLSIGLGLSVLLFGLMIRIFERSYFNPERNVNFNYVWNSFWCVIVTMTTIGYGDIYAETHLGRFVSIGACLWGVFLLSLFVVIMNVYSEMTKQELISYEELEREQKISQKLRKEAALVIQRHQRLRLLQKRGQERKKILLARAELIRTTNNFKIKRVY